MKSTVFRHNRLFFRLVAFSCAVLIASCSIAPSNGSLYEEFRTYRLDVEAESIEYNSALGYFSDAVVSDWLDVLLSAKPVPTIRQIEMIRAEYQFGLDIQVIHSFEESEIEEGRYLLVLLYSNDQRDGLQKIGLEYIEENGRLVIDFFNYDLDDLGLPPQEILETF